MIHTYSLIHDDLPCMDNDDLRRGNQLIISIWWRYCSFSWWYIIKWSNEFNDEVFIKAWKRSFNGSTKIAEASGPEGMIGGQIVDIINEGKKISEEELKYMHMKKLEHLLMFQ